MVCFFLSLFCFDSLISSLLFSSFRDRQTLTLVSWWQNQWVGAVDTERQSVFVRPTIVSRVPQHLYFRHLRFCISQIFPFVFLQTLPQYLLPSTAVTLHNNSSHVKRIWVIFCRTGKTPASCPFCKKKISKNVLTLHHNIYIITIVIGITITMPEVNIST